MSMRSIVEPAAGAGRGARPFEPPKRHGWGFNPRTGRLTFFTPRSVATYRADPPMCWYRCEEQPQWRGSHGGDFELHSLVSAARRYPVRLDVEGRRLVRSRARPGIAAYAGFHDLLDPEAVELAARVGRDSWLLYCLLVRVPELRELAASDPSLAMLIAAHRKETGWRFARVRRWGNRRRTEILRACGLPPRKRWLKLLRRVPHEALSTEVVTRIATLARERPQIIKRLWHLPRLNVGALELVSPEFEPHVRDTLLCEIGASVCEDHRWYWHWLSGVPGTLRDTLAMLAAAERPIPRFRSVDHVGAVHAELVSLGLARGPLSSKAFGQPPVPETKEITALRSPMALHLEAAHQHNCLAWSFWADHCYRGDMYIYRITAPERASLAITRQGERWRVCELRGRFNAEPTPATVRAVHTWLAAAAASSPRKQSAISRGESLEAVQTF